MVLENADLIRSTEPFECGVCLAECAAGDGAVLRDCLHMFCRACLAQAVQFSDEAEVKCPFRDHNYACDSTLQEREIKAVSVPVGRWSVLKVSSILIECDEDRR